MSARQQHLPGLRLPAFGQQLLDARLRGLVPERSWNGAQVICVVDDWKIAEKRYRLVVPPDVAPEDLDFMACAGLDVIIVYNSRRTDEARLKQTIHSMLRGLPAALQVFDVFAPHRTWLVKSRRVGIERKEFA